MDQSSTVLKRLLSKDGCGERVVDMLQRLDREFADFWRCLLSIHQRQPHHDVLQSSLRRTYALSPVGRLAMAMTGSVPIAFTPRRNRNSGT